MASTHAETSIEIRPDLLAVLSSPGRAEGEAVHESARAEGEGASEASESQTSRQHAKVESALLLEPSLLDGLDDLPMRAALAAPFYTYRNSARVGCGPAAMVRWGAQEGTFSVPNSKVLRSEFPKDEWDLVYQPLQERGMARKLGERKYELMRAPAVDAAGFRPSRDRRTPALLLRPRNTVPHVMLPAVYCEDAETVRNLSAIQLRALFALHALSDLQAHGGVDPNHVRISRGRMVVSPDLAERLGDASAMLRYLEEFHALGELVLVSADLREVEYFPAARPHIEYFGPDDRGEHFVVRMTRTVAAVEPQ